MIDRNEISTFYDKVREGQLQPMSIAAIMAVIALAVLALGGI